MKSLRKNLRHLPGRKSTGAKTAFIRFLLLFVLAGAYLAGGRKVFAGSDEIYSFYVPCEDWMHYVFEDDKPHTEIYAPADPGTPTPDLQDVRDNYGYHYPEGAYIHFWMNSKADFYLTDSYGNEQKLNPTVSGYVDNQREVSFYMPAKDIYLVLEWEEYPGFSLKPDPGHVPAPAEVVPDPTPTPTPEPLPPTPTPEPEPLPPTPTPEPLPPTPTPEPLPETYTISFHLISREQEIAVPGAVFSLEGQNGYYQSSYYNGTYSFQGVQEGTYTLHQTIVPDGYFAIEDVGFYVDGSRDIGYYKCSTVKLYVSCLCEGKEVKGVWPSLVRNGSYMYEWETNGDGYLIYGIPAGDYSLVIDRVPDGYVMPARVPVHVNNTSDVQMAFIEIPRRKTADVTLRVYEKWTGSLVGGGSFTLSNGYTNYQMSGQGGVYTATGVEFGTYFIRENYAPSGYVPAGDVTVVVDEFSEAFSIENAPIRAEFSLMDGTSLSGGFVSGAVMGLYNLSGTEVFRWTTGNGSYGVKALAPGNYTLRTISVPSGYFVPQDLSIYVAQKEGTQSYSQTADKTSINLRALDENGQPLRGIPMVMKDAGGKSVYEWSTGNSWILTGITPGTYTLEMQTVPEGYVDTGAQTFTVRNVTETQNLDYRCEASYFYIRVLDEKDRYLPGATITLTRDGETVSFATGNDQTKVTGLKAGNYQVEIRVPSGYAEKPKMSASLTGHEKGNTMTVRLERKAPSFEGITLKDILSRFRSPFILFLRNLLFPGETWPEN